VIVIAITVGSCNSPSSSDPAPPDTPNTINALLNNAWYTTPCIENFHSFSSLSFFGKDAQGREMTIELTNITDTGTYGIPNTIIGIDSITNQRIGLGYQYRSSDSSLIKYIMNTAWEPIGSIHVSEYSDTCFKATFYATLHICECNKGPEFLYVTQGGVNLRLSK
jgi:hypothetical protein